MKKKCFTFLFIFIATLTFAQKTVIKTDAAPAPIGPYSQAIEANGMVFVAGQIGLNPQTRQLVAGGFEAETTQIMENIKAVLGAAKLSLDDVVNTTIYVKDLAHFAKINEIYGKYFSGNFPARATVGVDNLPGGAALEIAVIAVRGPRKK